MLKEVKGENVTEVPIMLVGNKKDENQVIYFCQVDSGKKIHYIII